MVAFRAGFSVAFGFLISATGASATSESPPPVVPANPSITAPAAPQASIAPAPAVAVAPVVAPVVAPKPKPAITLRAKIDLTNQTVTISEHGNSLHVWKISSGTQDFRTPTGTFRPQWMAKMWYSKKYDDAPMPHSVFFKDGVALHATQATHLLGRPASHGCVRLAPKNAEKFYALVQKHGMTQTQIHVFGEPRFAPAVAKRDRQDQMAQTGAAVPRMRQGRYLSAYAPVASPAPVGASWFGANPYRYPGDPMPVRQIYRYGTR